MLILDRWTSCCNIYVTFDFGSAKMLTTVIFETYQIAPHDYYMYYYIDCTISVDCYSSVKKFYSFITSIFQIDGAILLLKAL